MQDTFPAGCVSSDWAALLKNRKKRKKQPNQFHLTVCIFYFIFLGSAEKAPQNKPQNFLIKSLEANLPLPERAPNTAASTAWPDSASWGSGTQQEPQLLLCTEQMFVLRGDNLSQCRPTKSRCLSAPLAPSGSWADQQWANTTLRSQESEEQVQERLPPHSYCGICPSSHTSLEASLFDKALCTSFCICKRFLKYRAWSVLLLPP